MAKEIHELNLTSNLKNTDAFVIDKNNGGNAEKCTMEQIKSYTMNYFPTELPASDVPAWAKNPTKPAYTATEIGALPNTYTPPSNINDSSSSALTTWSSSKIQSEINSIENEMSNISSNISNSNFTLGDTNWHCKRLRSMGIGNNCWANKLLNATPYDKYTNSDSYVELKNYGFNAVRFYVHYASFEDDDNPYTYKQTGWDWLDQNLTWCANNGIVMVLSIHVPQGGFINTSNCRLYDSDSEAIAYRDRLKALWLQVATRYKNNPTMVGYDLLNEPFLPYNADSTIPLDNYYDYVQDIIDGIRAIDTNKFIVLQRPFGMLKTISGSGTTVTYYDFPDSFRLINDERILYDIHWYEPTSFCNQNRDTKDLLKYNNDYMAISRGGSSNITLKWYNTINNYSYTSSSWQQLVSDFIVGDTTKGNYFFWVISAYNAGSGSVIYIDDLEIEEYDADENYIQTIYNTDYIKSTPTIYGWNMGTSTSNSAWSFDKTISHNNSHIGSVKLSDVIESYQFYIKDSRNSLVLKDGYKYKFKMYVKLSNCSSTVSFKFGMQYCLANHLFTMNKDFLRYELEKKINWAKENNVELYFGEFAPNGHLITNNNLTNAIEWVKDMIDLFDEYGLNYSYHEYRSYNWGLYSDGWYYDSSGNQITENEYPNASYKRTALADVFNTYVE